MGSSSEKIDSSTLPPSLQDTIADAARHDSFVFIEREGKVLGVVISPRDYAMLLNRKRALADLAEITETLRSKFDDLTEDVALARAEEAALGVREESHSTRTTQSSPDTADHNSHGA